MDILHFMHLNELREYKKSCDECSLCVYLVHDNFRPSDALPCALPCHFKDRGIQQLSSLMQLFYFSESVKFQYQRTSGENLSYAMYTFE